MLRTAHPGLRETSKVAEILGRPDRASSATSSPTRTPSWASSRTRSARSPAGSTRPGEIGARSPPRGGDADRAPASSGCPTFLAELEPTMARARQPRPTPRRRCCATSSARRRPERVLHPPRAVRRGLAPGVPLARRHLGDRATRVHARAARRSTSCAARGRRADARQAAAPVPRAADRPQPRPSTRTRAPRRAPRRRRTRTRTPARRGAASPRWSRSSTTSTGRRSRSTSSTSSATSCGPRTSSSRTAPTSRTTCGRRRWEAPRSRTRSAVSAAATSAPTSPASPPRTRPIPTAAGSASPEGQNGSDGGQTGSPRLAKTLPSKPGERRSAGQPAALALPGQFDPSVPHVTLPPAISQLVEELRNGDVAGGVPNGQSTQQILDYLLAP